MDEKLKLPAWSVCGVIHARPTITWLRLTVTTLVSTIPVKASAAGWGIDGAAWPGGKGTENTKKMWRQTDFRTSRKRVHGSSLPLRVRLAKAKYRGVTKFGVRLALKRGGT